MGRIIDTRDPDTYISFSDYERAMKKGIEANKKRRADFLNAFNEKLSKFNMRLIFKERESFTDIYVLHNSEEIKIGVCADWLGQDIKVCAKKYVNEYINKSILNI